MEPEDEAFEELALKQGHWQHTSGWRKKQIMETSMTQDEIIEMAQECGLIGMRPHLDGIYSEALEAFAKLVAAKEREACAKVCEEYSATGKIEEFDRGWLACAKNTAAAIRARGQA
jgi:metal-dependent hydrolase (beta-lactamase superfamily II)